MMKPTRAEAIVALHDLFHRAFGNDKGSDEVYLNWCEVHGLCTLDEEGMADDWPGELEFLEAVGVTHAEMIEHLHINPKLFIDAEDESAGGGEGERG